MKKKYSSPELEMVKIHLTADVLNISDPADPIGQGSGSGAGPGDDPFGGLG